MRIYKNIAFPLIHMLGGMMIKIDNFKRAGEFIIKMTGNADINSANYIYEEFKKLYGEISLKCIIDVKDINYIDITFIQILVSLSTRLVKEGKEMELIIYDKNDSFIQVMEKNGIETKYFKFRIEK